MKSILGKAFIAIVWTVMIQVLLCLPGSTLPSGGMFDIPNLDKIVHVILFGGFTFLWCYFYYLKQWSSSQLAVIFFVIYVAAAVNGIVLEFIQRDYIPNRSFDPGDIIADMAGSSVAYGICNIRLIKKG